MSGFSDRRLDRNGLPGEIGGRGGNRTLICWLQASGPPVERLPQTWLRAGELNATRMAYEASMTPVHLPAETWSGKLGSNQRPLDYRSSAQTTLSFSRMEPRARFELAFPNYKSGASPTMLTGPANYGANGANRALIGRLPCDCSPTELHRLEPEGIFQIPTSALRVRCSST